MLKQDEVGAILTLEGCEAIGKSNEITVVVSPRSTFFWTNMELCQSLS